MKYHTRALVRKKVVNHRMNFSAQSPQIIIRFVDMCEAVSPHMLWKQKVKYIEVLFSSRIHQDLSCENL